ncbi:hypothetical protein PVMG_05160 [Plasmodium vivax Mauritania I]|uniref:Uncharacterized protein n=1 Tax=Plasmodium vivax Mauritania I TaxID=1035515 RepID=A0A0J9TKJ8_PLAVI|nr:hypothetical protein PVMG_05160 [Plasmodium vivax Mauritania I]
MERSEPRRHKRNFAPFHKTPQTWETLSTTGPSDLAACLLFCLVPYSPFEMQAGDINKVRSGDGSFPQSGHIGGGNAPSCVCMHVEGSDGGDGGAELTQLYVI